MITDEKHRREKLLAHGVPSQFLDAVDRAAEDEDLRWELKYPDAAYFYLKDIIDMYSIFEGFDVTPIFDSVNGDSYWVLLSNTREAKFVHFELEQDEIYDDYGDDFWLLFADFVVTFYESADHLEIEELGAKVQSMGFRKAHELLAALQEADKESLRDTFERNEKWKRDNLPRFI